MKALVLAKDLRMPQECATETFGFLGKKGGGKTYGAQKLFELLYGSEVQCVALDPVGNWWNLRSSADGKGAGLPVYVFGGPHGDIPLEVTAGAFIARVVVDRGISVVLDVSRFRKGERKRFMTDFAEEFFHLKKDAVSPVHLFVEEAHVFVPQKPQKGEERMLGAMEDLVRIGRNYGIGCSLISQRAASVNKDVLTQVECLFAFQTSSAQDRRALKDWIEENDIEGLQLLAELSKLAKGDALFWSPSFMRLFAKVHIEAKDTFDGSATPKVGERVRKVKELAAVDLVDIREAMKETIERAEENDVTALKEKIRKLQERVDIAGLQKVKEVTGKLKTVRVEVPVVSDAQLKRLEKAIEKLDNIRDRTAQAQQVVVSEAGNLRTMVEQAVKRWRDAPAQILSAPEPPKAALRRAAKPARDEGEGEGWDPPAGARKILAALFASQRYALPRGVLALRSLTTTKSGTFGTYVSKLVGCGYVERQVNDQLGLTAEGKAYIEQHPTSVPRPGLDLITAWKTEFDGRAKDMLEYIAGQWPGSVSRSQVADALAMPESSGTFGTYLSRITGKGLVVKDGNRCLKAADALMT